MECHSYFVFFYIVFSVPPKITPFSFARDLNVGDRTSIQCVVVTGDLPLTFTWLKDNVPIETRDQDSSGSSNGVSINGQSKSNSGKNDGRGDNTESGIKNMLSKGRSSSSSSSSSTSSRMFKQNNNKNIHRIDQSLEESITIRHYDAFNSALSVSTITPAHNGTYTCRVTNGAATVAHSTLLLVNGNESPFSLLLVSVYLNNHQHIIIPNYITKQTPYLLFYFHFIHFITLFFS